MNYTYNGALDNRTRHDAKGLRRSLGGCMRFGAMKNYPLGGRCERPGPGKGGGTDPARACTSCISDQDVLPKGGLRLRLDAAASAEKGITVFDVPGIGSPPAATRPPLLCHLHVSAHGMGHLQSQVKSRYLGSKPRYLAKT